MPAVAKTSDEEIVRAARALVERHGPSALSMQAVADAVGVRPPSLYKRFQDRSALLAAVELEALTLLRRALERAGNTGTPASDLSAMGHAYRRFAKSHARLYELLFAAGAARGEEADGARALAARPVIERLSMLVGEPRALTSARVLTAFVHGFVSMENADAFRLGEGLKEEGVDQAFELGLRVLLATFATGLTTPPGTLRDMFRNYLR